MAEYKKSLYKNSNSTNKEQFKKEVNKTRKFWGFEPIIPQKRKCLRCEKDFISYGHNHRMCGCLKESET